jgi:hypothetical protein
MGNVLVPLDKAVEMLTEYMLDKASRVVVVYAMEYVESILSDIRVLNMIFNMSDPECDLAVRLKAEITRLDDLVTEFED